MGVPRLRFFAVFLHRICVAAVRTAPDCIAQVCIAVVCIAVVCTPAANAGGYDRFDDTESQPHFRSQSADLAVTIKGELKVTVRDIEGAGGPGHDSATDTRTIGTRSPTAQMEGFWLAPRFELPGDVYINTSLGFSETRAYTEQALLVWRPKHIAIAAEAGFAQPIVAVDRISERYPLIASAFWRFPEVHAAFAAQHPVGPVLFHGAVSLAITRPITFTNVGSDAEVTSTIRILSYGTARSYSGNHPELGAKAGVRHDFFSGEIFGFVGKLANEAGLDELRNTLVNFDPALRQTSRRHAWYGGRITIGPPVLSARAEVIGSQDSSLNRWGGYVELVSQWGMSNKNQALTHFEGVVRGETYRLVNAGQLGPDGMPLRSQSLAQAVTWDFHALTASLAIRFAKDFLLARIEYAWIYEDNAIPALDLPNQPFRNNELLTQLQFNF